MSELDRKKKTYSGQSFCQEEFYCELIGLFVVDTQQVSSRKCYNTVYGSFSFLCEYRYTVLRLDL